MLPTGLFAPGQFYKVLNDDDDEGQEEEEDQEIAAGVPSQVPEDVKRGAPTVLFKPREWRGARSHTVKANLFPRELAKEINGYPLSPTLLTHHKTEH